MGLKEHLLIGVTCLIGLCCWIYVGVLITNDAFAYPDHMDASGYAIGFAFMAIGMLTVSVIGFYEWMGWIKCQREPQQLKITSFMQSHRKTAE